jgi:23S rRNA (uracil1939-C5)-methyltransferase
MLRPGQDIELVVEKPAVGGRMLARLSNAGGQVVLVGGAIPGERVIARVERSGRDVAFASTVDVKEPSGDRRAGVADLLCGGCAYAHIAYPRQLLIKAEIVADAFRRIGRITLDWPVSVSASPEVGYRMRARLHADGSRIGFYREGTHTLCDAAATGQLNDAALRVASEAVGGLLQAGAHATAVELTENIAADQRALAVDVSDTGALTSSALESIARTCGLRGLVTRDQSGARVHAGEPTVADPMHLLTHGRISQGHLYRGPESFFQANRFLVADLVAAVMEGAAGERSVLDLYAGVGLFSLALAASGARRVIAVEGDRTSGVDLQRNASQLRGDAGHLMVVLDSVEAYLDRSRDNADTVIVDPPRTGISRRAVDALTTRAASRVIYVSCDPATMARDARRFVDAGYALESIRGFDLFPNTPHVETVCVFNRSRGE